MAVVVPVMLYEVVSRYVFNAPTVWGMELAVLLFGPYFLLGGPYLLHLRGHVALDLMRQRLDARWNRIFDLLNFPIIIAFCLILLVYSVPAAWSSWQYFETSFRLESAHLAVQGRGAGFARADAPAGDRRTAAGGLP